MSAPDTNLEKQKRRHRGPLVGMAVGVTFVAIIFLWMIGIVAFDGQTPEGAATQIDGRTGEQTTPAPELDGTAPATPTPAAPAEN